VVNACLSFLVPRSPCYRTKFSSLKHSQKSLEETAGSVKSGVVALKGDVETPAQRARVKRTAASGIPGVQQVVNELQVKGGEERSGSGQ
jgi:hypothetical protein